jgi:CubicO group peptidase (beta-lactamase class C family)
MTRLLMIVVVAAIAAVGLFPGLLGTTSYAPVPYCGPTASFQPTFALADSEIVFLAEQVPDSDLRRIGALEIALDALRRDLLIPGFSAAVVRDRRLIWARGFGCADIASGTAATPHTPYHLASLTKPFGATVLLGLVEEGHVDLEDPIGDYGIDLASPGTIRVKHLLSHTSEGLPGSGYRYNGDRFGLIDRVIESVTGSTFRDVLIEEIVNPLDLRDTLPAPVGEEVAGYELGEGDPRFQQAWDRLATPYWLVDGYGNVVSEYAEYFGSAAGLISSVVDYAAFDIAIDEHRFLSASTQALAWTPFRSTGGRRLPYGYGWFVQTWRGEELIWHYGYWNSTSTLILKAPRRGLAFLIMANSDRLSSTPLFLGSDENVRRSAAARIFLDTFLD